MNRAQRTVVNEAAVRWFPASWDPAWRWVLVLGLRNLRANASRLGELAAGASGGPGWRDEGYVYGPLALVITATAVNETAQHCEDLFALLKFLPDPVDFVKRMTSYNAGQVTNLAPRLVDDDTGVVRSRFFVPAPEVVTQGLEEASDPAGATAQVEEAVARLVALTRDVAGWYLAHQFFHVQYKHGLELPLRPFGPTLPAETISKRRTDVRAPLIAFTNEPLASTLARPPAQQGVIFPNLGPEVRDNAVELLGDRALLRYQMSGLDVDLDEVVAISATVARLLHIVAWNRLTISHGPGPNGEQEFLLPGPTQGEELRVSLGLASAAVLNDFRATASRRSRST